MGDSRYDDLLFLRMSSYLGKLQWLGPYDELTLAKGAAYPLFILISRMTFLPLKLTEQAFYLASALSFVLAANKIWKSRGGAVVCFAILALNPTAWAAPVGGRIVREGLYSSLVLLLLALSIRIFAVQASPAVRGDLVAKRRDLIALGVAAAAFWLTREEGVWLIPALAIPICYWVVNNRKSMRDPVIFGHLALPVLCFAAIVFAVNATNWAVYGVFRNNDFRSADFQGAYGALSRITHDHWERFVVFPKDARMRAYKVSPAAAELREFFEGDGSMAWRRTSCEQTERADCPEILSGWFMWALREAAAKAGHYRSAPESQAFYVRLAREVNEGCDKGLIPCSSKRETLAPPWRSGYLGDTLDAAKRVFGTLISLRGAEPVVLASIGDPRNIAMFQKITHGPIATETVSEPRGIRQHLAFPIARFEQRILPIVTLLSVAAWIALLMSRRKLTWHPGNIVVLMLVATVGARVALLAVLEATSIPSNNMLYLSPVVPILLAFAPCVFVWACTEFPRSPRDLRAR